MLRQLLRRFGVLRVSTGLTVVSVILSVLITTAFGFTLGGGGRGIAGLTLASLAPLVIAPLMGYPMLALLNWAWLCHNAAQLATNLRLKGMG